MFFLNRHEVLFQKKQKAIRLLQNGRTKAYTAKITRRSRSTIYRWISEYYRNSLKVPHTKASDGRPPKLSERQREELSRILEKEFPDKYSPGFKGRALTLHAVKRIIWQRFRVRYHVSHVWKLLQEMNWKYETVKYYSYYWDKVRKNSWNYKRGRWERSH